MTVFRRSVLAAGLLAATFLGASPLAQAGFQWTAPAANATAPVAVTPRAPAAAPVAPVESMALPENMDAVQGGTAVPATADDPISWNAPAGAGTPFAKAAPRAPQNVLPVDSTPLADTITDANTFAGQYDVANGFGRDLPVVMAIRQIVPAQYGFVFDDGIDLSTRVSWQGGKPWDIVLQETLAPLDLTAAINGKVVSVTRAGARTGTPVQPAAAQMSTQTIDDTTTSDMTPTPMAMPATQDMAGSGGYAATPVSAAADMAAPAGLAATTMWSAPRNSSLRAILEDWSAKAGVELYWASEYDYPIQSAVNVQGTFEEAVQTLMKGLADSRPRPLGRLHPNLPDGPAVLVIETRQNSL